MSASDPHDPGSRGSRRSRVSDPIDDSAPPSPYDAPTDPDPDPDPDTMTRHSLPPLPIKPPPSIDADPRLAGNAADEYYNDIVTTPSDDVPTSPTQALSRRRTSSHGLSHSHSPSHAHSSRRTRSHSSARDVLRLLLKAEGSESKDALTLLRRAHDRLEAESLRANEAERRVQEANDRWRLINQARLQAQAEASRINEELRLYKLQLEAAQQQIARANDTISQTDKEKAQAEDDAAKARRLAKKYEIESLVQKAREEGRRIGRAQGLQEGRENGYYEGLRTYGREDYDPDRVPYDDRQAYDDQTYDGRAYDDEDGYPNDYREDGRRPMQYVPAPVRAEDARMQARQHTPRSALNGFPPQARNVANSTAWHRPRHSILSSFSRIGKGHRRAPDMDRNVAVNPSNAPDVASIVDEVPLNPITSPLPPEETSQVNHTTPMRMPVPDFNPDPSDVHPISLPNRPRSPAHLPTAIPPDGYIPRRDDDGSIRLPPPHELTQAPPTPHSYNSPMPNSANLPPSEPAELPQREREPITRDFVYPQGQQQHQQHQRSLGKHRYQKSVADSDDSVATAALSIVSPPGARQSAMQNRLSAIPEHDPRYASPTGSMRQAEGTVYPGTPRSRSSRRGELSGVYPPDDPEAPIPPEMGATFSPRSIRSGFGPPRPSRLTTPAPLATPLTPDGLGQPAYTRPRINSVASGSDIGGPIGDPGGTPRPRRNRERTPAPEYGSSRPPRAAEVQTPEINIVPASRSNSSQSKGSNVHRDIQSPRMTPYIQQMPVPKPPSPVFIPGMPKGSVPTSPIPGSTENLPRGFVPTTQTTPIPDGAPVFVPLSPSAPEGVPPGFVPNSPAVSYSPAAPPGAPPGFVPNSPAILPGLPPGFVPNSPAAPSGAPPGFISTTPTIPGALFGFVPTSPMPEGAPAGFVPASTSIPVSPLPAPLASPNMSVTGALPVLARSTSENYAGFCDSGSAGTGSATPRSPRVSFSGPNAGFNSRAASDWDTRSAWGDARSERSPRPVRGPELRSPRLEPEIVRPGSSLSRRDSSPVIPDPTTFQPSRASSSRRASRVSFGGAGDPMSVPLPVSSAPSLARSGRASSHSSARTTAENMPQGVARSRSARSDSSRARASIYPNAVPAANGMPMPGTPGRVSLSGMPPAGLGSPYSRRLEPHPEDADEYRVVSSDVSSQSTLTTPPAARRDLPRHRGTPAPAKRSLEPLAVRSPSASQSRASLFVPPDPADDPARLAPRPMDSSDRDPEPSLRRSASRQSLASNKSYAKFDPTEYVDPAVLTSGRSQLLPLPQEEPPAAAASPPTSAPAKGKKKGKKKR